MPAINRRELKRLYEASPARAVAHLREALAEGHLKPEDFSIRDLAESLVPDGAEWVRSMNPASKASLDLLEGAEAVNTSAFSNITGQIVYSKILQAYQQEEFVFSRLVENVPTSLNGEKIPGMTQLGDESEVVAESDDYPVAGFAEDYIETPATEKRGLIVPVTKEAIFFDRTGLILGRAKAVGEFVGLKKEKRLIDCFIDGNTTAYRYKWRGTSYATYQSSTPWINLKTTNALADWTNVDAAEQLLANMVDPWTGEPVLFNASDLVICPELLHKARHVIQATTLNIGGDQGGGSAATTTRMLTANSVQPYNLIVSRLLKARLSAASVATTTWFLSNVKRHLVYMENWPLKVEQAPMNAEAEFRRDIVAQFKASERGTPATMEPRSTVKNTA